MAKYYDTSKFSGASSYEDFLNQLSSYQSSKSATKKGYQMSSADLASLYADYYATQDERSYNEYYYNTYESPSAMVSQYQDAGLNPALMYGSSATSSTNNSTGYNGSSQSDTEQGDFQNLLQVLQLVMTGSQIGSQVMLNRSQSEKNKSDARLQNAEAESQERENYKKSLYDGTFNEYEAQAITIIQESYHIAEKRLQTRLQNALLWLDYDKLKPAQIKAQEILNEINEDTKEDQKVKIRRDAENALFDGIGWKILFKDDSVKEMLPNLFENLLQMKEQTLDIIKSKLND